MPEKLKNALKFAVIGALPGLLLVLLAQFVIKGEMQLSVGAPGLILLPMGFVGGLIYGWFK
ncbi:hypothetical protein FKR81_21565 [Lentzea tibetensis]|uniref:Uncharacterized protein n=1 Tax=Lentzea tibetensis TaxID=2591470 RepID=A0A563ERK5_9PSEU|nr:hypothetical protein [Lentzea tibetensis]TWP50290.1 hypothetical protein FKR81_21565 [Lentzea tibetensis]